jgi:hypothetical protein
MSDPPRDTRGNLCRVIDLDPQPRAPRRHATRAHDLSEGFKIVGRR